MTTSSIFTQFGHELLEKDLQKMLVFPFKDHPQIPFIFDTLSRHERHHLGLITTCSEKIVYALCQTLAQHITTGHVPRTLQHCHFIYFDMARFNVCSLTKEHIAKDFLELTHYLHTHNKRAILVINQSHFLNNSSQVPIFSFWQSVNSILFDQAWRVILFAHPKDQHRFIELKDYFSVAHFIYPQKNEQLALLKNHRAHLENFHQVIISDETISNAYTMAAHYLPGQSCFDKTLELLDSAAARASTQPSTDATHKAIVSTHLLAQVVSSWTHIPLTHLQHNKIQAQKFVEVIRKQLFGQDTAIHYIASLLQNACINLQDSHGPLCSLLFVGATSVGKTTMAYAIAEHLFGHKNALLRVDLNHAQYRSLDEIKISTDKNELGHATLFSAIQQTPYAVVLIEDIDQMDTDTFNLFKDIFLNGIVFDKQGNAYDFRYAVLIATTRYASESIHDLTTTHRSDDSSKPLDLMQLILNEPSHDNTPHHHMHLTPQELCDELLPKLTQHFSSAFLQKLHVVPFVPLDYAALEKIIQLKIKTLAQHLHTHFGIELKYAPEIIKFLAHEAFWRKTNTKSLENLMDQYLYSCIAHAILLQAENKNRPKRLLVQLNDSGQLLRCEFITSNETIYNL